MTLFTRWRRPVAPADLPPVPGVVRAGLLADVDDPIAKPQPTPQPTPEPEPAPTGALRPKPKPPTAPAPAYPTPWFDQEPHRVEPITIPGLAPLTAPRLPLVPGRYVVEYDRIGRYGSTWSRLPAPAPLTCVALDAADLAEQVRHDCHAYLGHEGVRVVVDTTARGGLIYLHGRPAGGFSYELVAAGGAR
jgi:hypothetical protein